MSLFSSLDVGSTSLNTAQSALQTTGNNIANATTDGYTRQRVEQVEELSQDFGRFEVGGGVKIDRVRRLVDDTLSANIRDAQAQSGNLGVQQDTLDRVQSLVNAFSGSDLSSGLSAFFDSLQNLANSPEDVSAREVVVQKGEDLAQRFQQLSQEVQAARESVNQDIQTRVGDVNRILKELASLNQQILKAEHGGIDIDSANNLRDRQDLLLKNLSNLVQVRTVKTSTGAVQVLAGSDFLVFDDHAATIGVRQTTDRGTKISTPFIEDNGAKLTLNGGEMAGLVNVRDGALANLLDNLDTLAGGLAYAFNQVHVEGEGLHRFTTLTSTESVPQASISNAPIATNGKVTGVTAENALTDSALSAFPPNTFVGLDVVMTSGADAGERRKILASDGTGTIQFDGAFDHPLSTGDTFQITGLPFVINNGSFQVKTTNETTGQTTTSTIPVDIDGILPDSTLSSIATAISAVPGLSATVTNTNQLQVQATAPNTTFSFGTDTSGFLAAIGMNTFFQGSKATDLQVNPLIANDPSLVAAAQSNAVGDNSNALALVGVRDQKAFAGGTQTAEDFLSGIVSGLGTQVSALKDQTSNQNLLLQQLENQQQRISGVNLDEEATNLITFQRTFQASAKFISVIDGLLNDLIQTV